MLHPFGNNTNQKGFQVRSPQVTVDVISFTTASRSHGMRQFRIVSRFHDVAIWKQMVGTGQDLDAAIGACRIVQGHPDGDFRRPIYPGEKIPVPGQDRSLASRFVQTEGTSP